MMIQDPKKPPADPKETPQPKQTAKDTEETPPPQPITDWASI